MQTFFLSVFLFFEGWPVTEEQLEEVAQRSGVLDKNDDFLTPDFRAKCEQVIADPLTLDCADYFYAFRYVKENIPL